MWDRYPHNAPNFDASRATYVNVGLDLRQIKLRRVDKDLVYYNRARNPGLDNLYASLTELLKVLA